MDDQHDGHCGQDFSIFFFFFFFFFLHVALTLPTKYLVNLPFGAGKNAQKDFQNGSYGGHLGFLIGKSLAFLSTSFDDSSYQLLNQLSFSRDEAQNIYFKMSAMADVFDSGSERS